MRAKAKDPRLVSLIGEFLKTYLPVVRKRDPNTVASYRSSINVFLEYLAHARGLTLATAAVADFSQANVVGFVTWLVGERGNAATTANHRLSDIRGFCRFLWRKGAISALAFEEVREVGDVPDDRAVEFTWLEPGEVAAAVGSVAGNRHAARDGFLLTLLYESGGRIGEVLALRAGDLRPTGNGEADVHFFGKGNKHRVTPLTASLWERYGEFERACHPGGADPSDLLFYVERGGGRRMMSQDNVKRILDGSTAALRAGAYPELEHLHSHLFRRSRAMHLYQAGVPLPTISDWLGHSNIETTRFYAKLTELMKRDAVAKLAEGPEAVFDPLVPFKYADDEEALKRLCGLK